MHTRTGTLADKRARRHTHAHIYAHKQTHSVVFLQEKKSLLELFSTGSLCNSTYVEVLFLFPGGQGGPFYPFHANREQTLEE